MAANKEDAPKGDPFFTLAKAYHINYLFDEAIKYYNEFKKQHRLASKNFRLTGK